MRHVTRNPDPPEALSRRYSRDDKTELQRAITHMADPAKTKKYEFGRYRDAQVKDALEALFFGKCAYCESFFAGTQPVDVEHYRPKAGIDGQTEHEGYWWLAMDWNNLLPSCIDCNRRRKQKIVNTVDDVPPLPELQSQATFDRTLSIESLGKATAFPLLEESTRIRATNLSEAEIDSLVVDGESRLLLDPTRDNPSQHIDFHISKESPVGLAMPKVQIVNADEEPQASKMGRVSIQVYGLNRLGLVQARTRILRDLEFMVHLLEGLVDIRLEIEERLGDKQGLPIIDQEVQADINLLTKAAARMERFETEIKARLKMLAGPAAPFSECARAWLAEHLK